jgi:ribose 5-phosphate isomerase B
MMEKIAIGSDHAGYEKKAVVIKHLMDLGYEVKDFGTYSDESTDYPDFAHPVATAVEDGSYDLGVLFCGSANGVSMTANKHQHIRAALSWIPEIARLAREHNNANIVAIPARYVSDKEATEIVDAFLNATFEGGRHERRVNKIALD